MVGQVFTNRSEERRVGKSVDHGVTGVQTCALPICTYYIAGGTLSGNGTIEGDVSLTVPPCGNGWAGFHEQIGRASCRKECRSRCDWSSDVCSSDLHLLHCRRNVVGKWDDRR